VVIAELVELLPAEVMEDLTAAKLLAPQENTAGPETGNAASAFDSMDDVSQCKSIEGLCGWEGVLPGMVYSPLEG
jgi:hypothetical protein